MVDIKHAHNSLTDPGMTTGCDRCARHRRAAALNGTHSNQRHSAHQPLTGAAISRLTNSRSQRHLFTNHPSRTLLSPFCRWDLVERTRNRRFGRLTRSVSRDNLTPTFGDDFSRGTGVRAICGGVPNACRCRALLPLTPLHTGRVTFTGLHLTSPQTLQTPHGAQPPLLFISAFLSRLFSGHFRDDCSAVDMNHLFAHSGI